MFALSLPMTKLAVGNSDAPLLSAWFSSFGRAAVAGILSAIYLLFTHARLPKGNQWRTLGLIGLGNAIGFPILQTVGLLYVPSSHAAVFNGLSLFWRRRRLRRLFSPTCAHAFLALGGVGRFVGGGVCALALCMSRMV